MKCQDCKGTGRYLGAGYVPPEDCRRCGGTGEEPKPTPKSTDNPYNKIRAATTEIYKTTGSHPDVQLVTNMELARATIRAIREITEAVRERTQP